MKHLIIILSLLTLLQSCHYSCFNCTGPQYISCLSCTNNNSLTVVQDPNTTPSIYWSSVYQTGTCVDTMGPRINPLGIVLFIILSAICIITATKQSFYLLFTIQTFGLYNLVDIAWVNPIGYLLQSMQHLMIWNIISSKFKTTDYTFVTNKYYRLNVFLYQADIGQNIALIAAFTILSMVLLIIICIVAVRRKKQAQLKEKEDREMVIFQNVSSQQKKEIKKQKEEEPKPTCMQWFSEKILIQIAKFLLSVLYLMVQETSLVLLVSLLFKLNSTVIILSVIYLHILIFTMSYAYYYRVQYFKEKNVMYINFSKKVILPIMVVVPLKYQFLLFLFAAIIIVVECIIDCYNGLYKKFNRLAFYKALELLIVALLIIYYLTETSASGGGYSSSKAAAVACTFAMAFYLVLFVGVQLPIGIKERFFSNKTKNQQQNHEEYDQKLPNPLQETLNDCNEQKKQNYEILDMMGSKSNESNQNQAIIIEKHQDKNTRDDNSSVKHSVIGNNNNIQLQEVQVEAPKPQPVQKKRRKQILDKELRMRYGI